MKFSFDFDLDDWLAYQRFYSNTNPRIKRSRLISKFIVPVALALIVNIMYGTHDPIPWLIYAVYITVFLLTYTKRMDRRFTKRILKHLKGGDNSSLLGPHELELTQEHIHLVLPQSEQKIKWGGIKRLEETDQYYFLFDTALSAVIIPKHKIDVDLDELSKLIRSSVSV